ncbi:GH23684 [Drosophila grimshawi]|uniref:GH23684 n=1 Tax=Drosophila grimshawi TaxID=7222 RepID=B4K3M9_DROGR|nr:GH23684 [Drosophila grimshawi]
MHYRVAGYRGIQLKVTASTGVGVSTGAAHGLMDSWTHGLLDWRTDKSTGLTLPRHLTRAALAAVSLQDVQHDICPPTAVAVVLIALLFFFNSIPCKISSIKCIFILSKNISINMYIYI